MDTELPDRGNTTAPCAVFIVCVCDGIFSPVVTIAQDYAYNATFPEFRSRAEGAGKQVLEVIQIFLNHVRQEGELGLPEVGDAGDPEVFEVRAGGVRHLVLHSDTNCHVAVRKNVNCYVGNRFTHLNTE